MSKQATSVNCGKTISSGLKMLLLAGIATAGSLFQPGSADAQQAYYYPQTGTAQVSVNYGALSPYAAPGVPTGFQPYGYAAPYAAPARVTAQPKSVFTPTAAPAYGAGAYGQPVYGYAPAYQAAPANVPFVAPYANPAFAPGFAANRAGLPISTPTSATPQSYLNVPGAQPFALKAPGEAAPAKKKKKKKATAPMPASTATATEEGAAAQVAAAEAALESGPAPAAPVVPEAPAAAAPAAEAAPEPMPAPTPPAEPAEVPASVPSPAANAPVAAIAPAAETSAAEAPAADTAAAEAPTAEVPAADASTADTPAEQVASAEAPEETAPDTSGAAVLPAGGTRIVFEGDSDDLPSGATGDLDAIADKMLADETIKIQVLAYSSGTPDAESQARRKALARGLEVRKYLIGKGVRSNRIDVRALGTKSEGNPADRVDIVPSAG